MPRFGDAPFRRPPPRSTLRVDFSRERNVIGTIGQVELDSLGPQAFVADFHCVTTWSVKGVAWTGVALADVFAHLGITETMGGYVVAVASDHRRATLVWDDAIAPDVLLATHLNGEALGRRHGGPVRLVAPQHYGYKSLKCLERIDVRSTPPRLGAKEHLRARVALEERHPKLPSGLVKFPYRLLIPPTAAIATRSLKAVDTTSGSTPASNDPRVGTKLANSQHAAPHWIVTTIAADFTLEDAWRIPGEGGPDDFAAFLAVVAARDRNDTDSHVARTLFRIRALLGTWFGWDDADARALPIPGCQETSLADRLPPRLQGSASGTELVSPIFVPIYQTHDEWAAEVSNGTVHAMMHIAWVDQGDGRYCGQMGVYVKPRGRLGAAYMAFIRPFRHRIIYPAMMRQLDRSWQARLNGA